MAKTRKHCEIAATATFQAVGTTPTQSELECSNQSGRKEARQRLHALCCPQPSAGANASDLQHEREHVSRGRRGAPCGASSRPNTSAGAGRPGHTADVVGVRAADTPLASQPSSLEVCHAQGETKQRHWLFFRPTVGPSSRMGHVSATPVTVQVG